MPRTTTTTAVRSARVGRKCRACDGPCACPTCHGIGKSVPLNHRCNRIEHRRPTMGEKRGPQGYWVEDHL